MNIYQIVPSLSYGDAIGNEAIAISEVIQDMGYQTKIYASYIDPRISEGVDYIEQIKVKEDDVVIYHKAIGTYVTDIFAELNCHKIMLYHNITPAEFMKEYNRKTTKLLVQGRVQLEAIKDKVEYCLSTSDYNKKELIEYGYREEKIDVLPLVIKFEDYEKVPNQEIIDQYKDGNTNILFVGRLSPNKKQEDVIKAFYYYKTQIDPKARLFLVGSYGGTEKYYAKLRGFVADLKLKDVYFTGHIPFQDILAYYKIADVFLCMSEHEGFCVPLVESMYFNVPIIAYDSTAISGTLNGSGILVKEKDYSQIADEIHRLVKDCTLRKEILDKQRQVLEGYSEAKTKALFKEYIMKFMERFNRG